MSDSLDSLLSRCPVFVWPPLALVAVASVTLYWQRRRVLFYGHHLVFLSALSVAIPLLIPVFLLRPRSVDNARRASHLLLRHVTRPLGVEWELRGAAALAEQRGAVVVANHQLTMLDVLGLFNIWQVLGRCAPVSRRWRCGAGPLGLLAWLAGVVFIDVTRPRRAQRQLRQAAKRLMCEQQVPTARHCAQWRNLAPFHVKQTKLWMYPEGALNRSPKSLLPFKKGAFRLAIECQMPLLPVVFSPYYFVDYDSLEFRRGKVVIQALDPISTAGLTEADVDSLASRTRTAMLEALVALTDEAAAAESLPPKSEPD